MKPKQIIFIRHGESLGNADLKAYETVPDHKLPLTLKGRQQAVKAGEEIASLLKGAALGVYGSPFLRTRQTRDGILSAINPSQLAFVKEDPRLREQEWGHLRKHEEMQKIEKERDAYGTFYFRIPDGESGADVYDRCTGFLDTLYRDFEKPDFPDNVLIVSHGLTIRLLLMRWLHWSVEEFESLKNPHNCQFYRMQLQDNGKFKLVDALTKQAPSPEL